MDVINTKNHKTFNISTSLLSDECEVFKTNIENIRNLENKNNLNKNCLNENNINQYNQINNLNWNQPYLINLVNSTVSKLSSNSNSNNNFDIQNNLLYNENINQNKIITYNNQSQLPYQKSFEELYEILKQQNIQINQINQNLKVDTSNQLIYNNKDNRNKFDNIYQNNNNTNLNSQDSWNLNNNYLQNNYSSLDFEENNFFPNSIDFQNINSFIVNNNFINNVENQNLNSLKSCQSFVNEVPITIPIIENNNFIKSSENNNNTGSTLVLNYLSKLLKSNEVEKYNILNLQGLLNEYNAKNKTENISPININLHMGIYANNLHKLFKMNVKGNLLKSIFEIQTENELMEYISNLTYYGPYIEATNVGKIIKLGLDKTQLIMIMKKWLLKMFSIEYANLKKTELNELLQNKNQDTKYFEEKNQNLNKYNSFNNLKNIINFYEEFLQNYDVIKTILYENNIEKININMKNYYHNNQIYKNEFNSNIKKHHIEPMYIKFTINSQNDYYKHKCFKNLSKKNYKFENSKIPQTVNCLIYTEKNFDIKLYMFGSKDGALPDHIIMNMPHLWSRNGKQFICHICENVYTRKYGLKIHLRTHNNNKPLKCEVCNKTFRDPSNLVKHSKIHNKTGTSFDSTNTISSESHNDISHDDYQNEHQDKEETQFTNQNIQNFQNNNYFNFFKENNQNQILYPEKNEQTLL